MDSSDVAWSKPGWRLRTVKASAQLMVEPSVDSWFVLSFVARMGTLGFLDLVAARDLQKRVLVGLERHWVQVPGPLMQGSKVLLLVVADSGGVGKLDSGGLRARSGRSLASSAQRQVVPSEQKPQGSGSAVAAMEDEVETEAVKVGGWRENCAVKSISEVVSGSDI